MVIGRVGIEPLELLGICGRAVLRNPELGDLEVLIAQHVEQRHLADDGAKQIRPLRQRRAHQQAAVAAAANGEMLLVGVAFFLQILGRGEEVVEDILLLVQHAGAMPVFAELAAAAQVGHGEDAVAIEPGKQRLVELGRQADIEAAVSGEQRRGCVR